MLPCLLISILSEFISNQRAEGGFNIFDSSFPKIFKISDFQSKNQQILYQYANNTIDISKFDDDNAKIFKKIEQKFD